jgi:hypothetical protein
MGRVPILQATLASLQKASGAERKCESGRVAKKG